MADLAERKDTKHILTQQETVAHGDVVPVVQSEYPASGGIDKQHLPLHAGECYDKNRLLSAENMAAVRDHNTKGNLKSNLWNDIAGYLRWASTLTLMGCLAIVGGSVATAVGEGVAIASAAPAVVVAGIAAGLGSSAFLICLAIGVALAAATMLASNHSRKLFTEKSFDVQDFQMQRQAALIGKSVEHAVDDPHLAGHQTKWTNKFEPRAMAENWAQAVKAESAAAETARV